MPRKFFAVLLALAICIAVALPSAACTYRPNQPTNVSIVQNMVDNANLQIEILVKKAQLTRVDDVAQLVKTTDAIADKTIHQAAILGVKVVCQYKYYWVDGRRVAIDPLKVAY